MAKRIRKRSPLIDPEAATLKGLQAMSKISVLAAQISEEAELVLKRAADMEERAQLLETAIEMNFWVQLRLSRTRELDDVEDASYVTTRIMELREEFFACVAISDFLASAGASTLDEDTG